MKLVLITKDDGFAARLVGYVARLGVALGLVLAVYKATAHDRRHGDRHRHGDRPKGSRVVNTRSIDARLEAEARKRRDERRDGRA